jgi:hypothetical protein
MAAVVIFSRADVDRGGMGHGDGVGRNRRVSARPSVLGDPMLPDCGSHSGFSRRMEEFFTRGLVFVLVLCTAAALGPPGARIRTLGKRFGVATRELCSQFPPTRTPCCRWTRSRPLLTPSSRRWIWPPTTAHHP